MESYFIGMDNDPIFGMLLDTDTKPFIGRCV